MPPRPFAMNPSYLAMVRGVRELHRLIAEGKDDSPEADTIRDSTERALGVAFGNRAATCPKSVRRPLLTARTCRILGAAEPAGLLETRRSSGGQKTGRLGIEPSTCSRQGGISCRPGDR